MVEAQSDILSELLADLEPHVLRTGHGSITGDGAFRCVARAALVKATEFARIATRAHPEPFFLTATLRGVCEDLIVLSFLSKLTDRDEVVLALNDDNLVDGLSSQHAFFGAERPWQPVLGDADGHREMAAAKLNDIASAHGWKVKGKVSFPTVWYMAEKEHLVPLYKFMYSATSKWVHCSPHILLRMGWGEPDTRSDASLKTRWSFSTRHFSAYYSAFNRIYSVYLLLLLLRMFVDDFEDRGAVVRLLDDIAHELKETLRWPELVTHEEMNLDPPGPLTRILMRARQDKP
jgi:hypothetical protein